VNCQAKAFRVACYKSKNDELIPADTVENLGGAYGQIYAQDFLAAVEAMSLQAWAREAAMDLVYVVEVADLADEVKRLEELATKAEVLADDLSIFAASMSARSAAHDEPLQAAATARIVTKLVEISECLTELGFEIEDLANGRKPS
jgi:hypothetical protein